MSLRTRPALPSTSTPAAAASGRQYSSSEVDSGIGTAFPWSGSHLAQSELVGVVSAGCVPFAFRFAVSCVRRSASPLSVGRSLMDDERGEQRRQRGVGGHDEAGFPDALQGDGAEAAGRAGPDPEHARPVAVSAARARRARTRPAPRTPLPPAAPSLGGDLQIVVVGLIEVHRPRRSLVDEHRPLIGARRRCPSARSRGRSAPSRARSSGGSPRPSGRPATRSRSAGMSAQASPHTHHDGGSGQHAPAARGIEPLPADDRR